MHRQCPVSYDNSYTYGPTTYITIIVIVDSPVGLWLYVRTWMYVCTVCTYLLIWTVLTCTYVLTCTNLYLLGLLTYFKILLGCTYLNVLLHSYSYAS